MSDPAELSLVAGPADAARLADLHAAAFDSPWSAAAFETLLEQPGVFAVGAGKGDGNAAGDGFILCRVVVDEAEILSLAVQPSARRSGLGRRLTDVAADLAAKAGAQSLFLEVAEDNPAAVALYQSAGFKAAGRRRGYYTRPDGEAVDALLLTLNLAGRLPTD